MQGSRCIAHPAGIQTHIDDRLLHFRQAPTVAIIEEKTSPDTAGVLAKVALSAPGCFAAFDDLVTLTVRAVDRDERHGPFLPKRDYEDEVQCDSNLSPSPLLKHYPDPQLLAPHDRWLSALRRPICQALWHLAGSPGTRAHPYLSTPSAPYPSLREHLHPDRVCPPLSLRDHPGPPVDGRLPPLSQKAQDAPRHPQSRRGQGVAAGPTPPQASGDPRHLVCDRRTGL